jgi:hypothetical protein
MTANEDGFTPSTGWFSAGQLADLREKAEQRASEFSSIRSVSVDAQDLLKLLDARDRLEEIEQRAAKALDHDEPRPVITRNEDGTKIAVLNPDGTYEWVLTTPEPGAAETDDNEVGSVLTED